MNVETTFDLKDKLVEDFFRLEEKRKSLNLNGQSAYWTKGIDALKKQQFPTTKNEDWKYTNLKPYIERDYSNYPSSALDKKINVSDYISSEEVYYITFVNGEWSEVNTKLPEGEGVVVSNLMFAIETEYKGVKNHFGKYLSLDDNIFSAINAASFTDGLFVEVADGVVLDKPIVCLYFSDRSQGNLTANYRNLFVVGENAQVKILEYNYSLNNANYVLNTFATEVCVGKSANVDYYKFQLDESKVSQVNQVEGKQGQSSVFTTNTFTLSGDLVRNEVNILLDGEHIESFLNGLYLTDGKMLVDNRSLMDHVQPNCMSDEFYKGIIGGQSRAVFNGKIMVHQEAQKTNAFQSNKNILDSDDATINTKPQLEIFADDVRCTHGATIGQIDKDALFYMQARGIGKDVARKLLLKSFAADVVERVQLDFAKDFLIDLIEKKLDQI